MKLLLPGPTEWPNERNLSLLYRWKSRVVFGNLWNSFPDGKEIFADPISVFHRRVPNLARNELTLLIAFMPRYLSPYVKLHLSFSLKKEKKILSSMKRFKRNLEKEKRRKAKKRIRHFVLHVSDLTRWKLITGRHGSGDYFSRLTGRDNWSAHFTCKRTVRRVVYDVLLISTRSSFRIIPAYSLP